MDYKEMVIKLLEDVDWESQCNSFCPSDLGYSDSDFYGKTCSDCNACMDNLARKIRETNE